MYQQRVNFNNQKKCLFSEFHKDDTEKGFDQVLWLGGKDHDIIAEVGAMNIMFAFENQIHTPRLDGTILAGVTRDSVITLLK